MKFLLLILLAFFVSCSSSDKQESEEVAEIDAIDEADLMLDDSGSEESGDGDIPPEEDDEMMDDPDQEMGLEEGDQETGLASVEPEQQQQETAMDLEQPIAEAETGPMNDDKLLYDVVENYQVKSGETLMLIAFNLYGDYTKWRYLMELNPGLRSNGRGLMAGQTVKYNPPVKKFVWNPDGLPHLILSGETLGSISMDKYNTTSKWRHLYENNQPMIKDPNLIFAGFTLYYVPARDMASQ